MTCRGIRDRLKRSELEEVPGSHPVPANGHRGGPLVRIQQWIEHVLANHNYYLGESYGPNDTTPYGFFDQVARLCVTFSMRRP